MAELILAGVMLALLGGAAFALYRWGGAGTRALKVEQELQDAKERIRHLRKRRLRGKRLLRRLRRGG